MTKNAVLSGRLPNAAPGTPPFKKSFRDERLVARAVVLDPDLLATCPPAVIAGDGMDAVTQLLEAFTSTGASPFTDAIARTGLEAAAGALPAWHAATRGGGAAGVERCGPGCHVLGGMLLGDRPRECRPGGGSRDRGGPRRGVPRAARDWAAGCSLAATTRANSRRWRHGLPARRRWPATPTPAGSWPATAR